MVIVFSRFNTLSEEYEIDLPFRVLPQTAGSHLFPFPKLAFMLSAELRIASPIIHAAALI